MQCREAVNILVKVAWIDYLVFRQFLAEKENFILCMLVRFSFLLYEYVEILYWNNFTHPQIMGIFKLNDVLSHCCCEDVKIQKYVPTISYSIQKSIIGAPKNCKSEIPWYAPSERLNISYPIQPIPI